MTAAAMTIETSNANQSVSHSCIRNPVNDDNVSKNDKKWMTGIVTPDTIEDDCDYNYATGAQETLATVVRTRGTPPMQAMCDLSLIRNSALLLVETDQGPGSFGHGDAAQIPPLTNTTRVTNLLFLSLQAACTNHDHNPTTTSPTSAVPISHRLSNYGSDSATKTPQLQQQQWWRQAVFDNAMTKSIAFKTTDSQEEFTRIGASSRNAA
ncbi:hypothetical protein EDB85DRAFT_1896576 [Lactarius pseudohatsudake]|nr:hypothetical protein EDB85DRAFT_1896576 [Lactarius pseudohatsudake]